MLTRQHCRDMPRLSFERMRPLWLKLTIVVVIKNTRLYENYTLTKQSEFIKSNLRALHTGVLISP